MVERFRHKRLKRFFDDDDRRGLPADMVERIGILLAALDASDTIEGMQRPSFRLHALKGNLGGHWAVTVRANWRITFRLADGNAFDVDFVDYHGLETAMPFKAPPHPGLGLRDDIEALGLSVAEAAEGLGVTRQQLYNVIGGKSAITPEMAVRLEKAVGGTADAWLRMQAAFDLSKIRERDAEIKVERLTPRVA